MRALLEVQDSPLAGVKVITPQIFEDFRGENLELYHTDSYKEHGIDLDFVQDNLSVSTKNVLRGIHGDAVTWKLVSCLYGKIYLLVVNCDEDSAHFGKWTSFTLSDRNRKQVLIPPKFGNGHLVLSEKALFHYKLSSYYDGDSQFSIRYDDKRFNFWWPVKDPLLSRRDEEADTAFTGKTN